MTNTLKRMSQYLLSILLMAAFLFWAFHEVDPHALWEAINKISTKWVCIIVATTLGTLIIRARRWIVLMRPFTRDVTLLQASLALAICYAANVFIPRSGEAVRTLSLHWTCGTSIGSVLGTVFVERTLDMLCLVILVGISIMAAREQISGAFPWMEFVTAAVLVVCLLAILLFVLISVYQAKAINHVGHLSGRISKRLSSFITRFLEAFIDGLQALRIRSAYTEIFVLSVLLNAGYLLIIYEAFLAFELTFPPHSLDLLSSLIVTAISSLGMVVPTAGGIGSYHFFFAESLTLLYSVPTTVALACATVVHAIATLTYVLSGGPAFFIQRHQQKTRNKIAAATKPI